MKNSVLTIIVLACFYSASAQQQKLAIDSLTENFYIYTTYNTYKDSRTPAHGMYMVTDNGVVMFDTPWDSTQFQPLLDSIMKKHHKKVLIAFATHWHEDKTAGLEYYRKLGVRTYTTIQTDELSKKNGKKRAEFLMLKDTLFNVGEYLFETFYPGPGHTEDNIVIWFPKARVLYSGCLIKGATDEDLGFLGDGNKLEYANSLKRVKQKFPNPKFITVAHNDWHDLNSLKHSIEMAEKLKKQDK